MDRILFGDNQFFGINHISDEKSRELTIKYRKDNAIIDTLKIAYQQNITSFMCTTHDRMFGVAKLMKNDHQLHQMVIYPCLPYAHKYANAVTELGIGGALKQYMPGNLMASLLKGGIAFVSKDYISMMKLMIDAELKMFKDVKTPIIFLQNVITDLLLGLGMGVVLKEFHDYILKKYNAEPGFISMNLPLLSDVLQKNGIKNPIICSSINVNGFRMSGGKEAYEKYLYHSTSRNIAMQVFSGGNLPPEKALEYVCSLPNIESILFGSSSSANISKTVSLIQKFDLQHG